MSFSQFASILIARRRSAIGLVVALVLIVATASLMQKRQYLASAAVLIDLKSADPVANNNTGAGSTSSSVMATQIDLIQSERVAQRAMKGLKLADDPAWREFWTKSTEGRGEFEPWLAEQLLKKLDVKPSRESNVVLIAYLSPDPVFAAKVANAFVRAYIDTTLELKVEPAKQYNAFFDERAKQLRTSLESAQVRLSAYQRAKGIVATDERLDVENSRLSELSSQVVMLQGAAAESSSRQGQGGANSQEVLANAMIGSITADLTRQEARLSETKERLGERHPQVVELRANIEQLRARLKTETGRFSSSLGVATNVDRARLGAAQAALAAQREKVLALRDQRNEAAVLLRDIDNAQRAYDAALARVTQTNLESQNTFTNVSIVKTASPPPFATSPRVLLNTAVAFVVGCLLAIGLALLREAADRRVRFDTDVTQSLRQPLLVTIPRAERGAPTGVAPGVRRSHMVKSFPKVTA